MSLDTLSDVLRGVRLRGAVFFSISSEGDWVQCKLQLKSDGSMRIMVELWDGNKKLADTPWTRFSPISK